MYPSFDTLKRAKTETDLEIAFERLMDRADRQFMRGAFSSQEAYDAWCDAAVAMFDLRLWEIHRDAILLERETETA